MNPPSVVGIETEYSICVVGKDAPDPITASQLLLGQCVEEEVGIATAPGPGHYSFMLGNGGRFYIDHAHPEYCTPELCEPRDVVAADKAGELLLDRCARRVNGQGLLPAGQMLVLHKNNSDRQSHSYGCHENYLLPAKTFEALFATGFDTPARHAALAVLLPFLVTRPILCGAGKVGSENGRPPTGYQLTQRADFFETLRGLQTTYNRPLLNTRDEPHVDGKRYRRLHVILGDANLAEYSTYLKVGTTQLVLALLEEWSAEPELLNLALANPLEAFQSVSRDLTLSRPLRLHNGVSATALELQRQYLARVKALLERKAAGPVEREVCHIWEESLDFLEKDWRLLSTRLDWAIKRQLLDRYLQRQGSDWERVTAWQSLVELTAGFELPDPTPDESGLRAALSAWDGQRAKQFFAQLAAGRLAFSDYLPQRALYFGLRRLDLDYHEIDLGGDGHPGGVYYRLQKRGAIERLIDDDAVSRYVDAPPASTRAYLRGMCIARYRLFIRAADWSQLLFAAPDGGELMLTLPDVFEGNAGSFADTLAGSPDVPWFWKDRLGLSVEQEKRRARDAASVPPASAESSTPIKERL